MGAVQCPSTTLGLELRRALNERADGCARPTDRAAAKRNGSGVDTLFDALVPGRTRDRVNGQHVFQAQVAIALKVDDGGWREGFLCGATRPNATALSGVRGVAGKAISVASLGAVPEAVKMVLALAWVSLTN